MLYLTDIYWLFIEFDIYPLCIAVNTISLNSSLMVTLQYPSAYKSCKAGCKAKCLY